jgi:hypothetical protein
MSDKGDFLESKIHEFERAPERRRYIEQVEAGQDLLTQFLDLYPFRKDAAAIQHLTSDRIYAPGSSGDYFFLWPEWRLRGLGGIFPRNDSAYVNARDHSETFKSLLEMAIPTDITVAERVDAPWERLAWFGGDKHIAKKIVSCYYADRCLPIFRTADLEHFAEAFGCLASEDWRHYRLAGWKLGQKWEYLGSQILAKLAPYRQRLGSHNSHLMYFLYHSAPPKGYDRRKLLGRPIAPRA